MASTNATVQIPVADGTTMPAYLVGPAAGHAPTGVIVAHELFGVNPDIRGVADDLAEAGYLTIAPEFYHRDAQPGRWLERDDAGRQEGFHLLNRLQRHQALGDVTACISWLRSQPAIEKIAMIGFSAGGHLSYLAACRLPITQTAVLYGGWLPTNQIRAALREAHIAHELVSYPGTGHAFFWPGTPAFSLQARDDAWSRILAMLTS